MINFLINKKWSILRHLIMILFLIINFIQLEDPSSFARSQIDNIETLMLKLKYINFWLTIISIIFVYLNLKILIPRFLLVEKFNIYMVYIFLCSIIYYVFQVKLINFMLVDFVKLFPVQELSIINYIGVSVTPLSFLCSCAGYKIFVKSIEDTKKYNELKEIQLKEELNNLKNQINPHFLFNTLNNLHTLIQKDAAKASEVVLGLSDVLRYQLYETDVHKVYLKKDIEIIKNILQIEKIRRDSFQFDLQSCSNTNDFVVPPFIFINFIENAIKHSADNVDTSYINIEFTSEKGLLNFKCINSKPIHKVSAKNGGIGLQNIKRRLELLYQNSYYLNIINNESHFEVALSIPINK
jgi:sensor histidine kinase YesM